jgi:dihydrodipicolinate synthase/N-acetylneuraminate lyase
MELPIAPRGLVADLITPFRPDLSIDEMGLERLLMRVAPHVEAVFLGSPIIGEGAALETGQRAELLEKALISLSAHDKPIFMWVTQNTREKTKECIAALKGLLDPKVDPKDHGAPVFWVDTPLYYHSNRGLPDYYRGLFDASDQPFLLHNHPQLIGTMAPPFKRHNIRTAILKELAPLPGMAGMIFSGTLDRAHHYRRACRRVSGFRIYDGDEAHFLDHPSTSGAVVPGAALAPRAWAEVTRSSLQLSADQKAYPDHLRQIWELGDYLRHLRERYDPSPVPVIKAVLAGIGVIEAPRCTVPAPDVTDTSKELVQLMSRFGDA